MEEPATERADSAHRAASDADAAALVWWQLLNLARAGGVHLPLRSATDAARVPPRCWRSAATGASLGGGPSRRERRLARRIVAPAPPSPQSVNR